MIWNRCPLLTLCLAVAAGLSGCSNPPVPHADYCEAEKRKVSEAERIIAALAYAAEHRRYDQRLPAFTQFREKIREQRPDVPNKALATAFYKSNPDCCRVVEPWVVSEYPTVGSGGEPYHDHFNSHREFQWVYDVLIEAPDKDGPYYQIKETEPVRLQSSACGKADFLTTG
jgi:hypothetical protein